jgi:hypothetical protein
MRRTTNRRPIRITEANLRRIIRQVIRESRGGLGNPAAIAAGVYFVAAAGAAVVGIADMISNNEVDYSIQSTVPSGYEDDYEKAISLTWNEDVNEAADAIRQALYREEKAQIKGFYQGKRCALELEFSEFKVLIKLSESNSGEWKKLTNIFNAELRHNPNADNRLEDIVRFLDENNPGKSGKYSRPMKFRPSTSYEEF